MKYIFIVTNIATIICSLVQPKVDLHSPNSDEAIPQEAKFSQDVDFYVVGSEEQNVSNQIDVEETIPKLSRELPTQSDRSVQHEKGYLTYLEELEKERDFYLSLEAYRNEINNINRITYNLMLARENFDRLSPYYLHAFKIEVAKQRQRLEGVASIGAESWNGELGADDSKPIIKDNLIKIEQLEQFVDINIKGRADASDV